MLDLFRPFFDGSYAPHGYCLLWQPELIWTHVIADALIALAYFSIPLVLISFVRRRNDIVFGKVFWLFALFITACGLTHVMAIWTLWDSVYGLEAIVKVVTAGASVATAATLWPLLPKALALPSPAALRAANAELAATISERDAALARMREEMAQREQAEAALLQSRKLEALGMLSGGIAHDFNNLLQAVGGNLELIERRSTEPDRVQRWSRNAHKAVQHGKALTSQMLAFSRVQKLVMATVSVAAVLDNVSELLKGSIGPSNRLEIVPIDEDLAVATDKAQLELAILNLVINARDAMPKGGTIAISAEGRTGDVHADLPVGDYVEISVRDNGVGMLPEVLERALEPFFTTKVVGEGAGLGLSMVFGVARQSGGTVQLDSTPGAGTTVSLILPRVPMRAVGEEEGNVAETVAEGGRSLAGRSILLIDDDDGVRETLVEALSEAEAKVVSASSGDVGLQHLRRMRPDLLVVDFAMPGLSGAEVASLARATHAGLPVLIVTGHARTAEVDAIAGPRVTVLQKPFSADTLIRTANSMIAESRRD
ncbi:MULTISPECIES: ATP-binding protein [Edaphosphingomonas]|uniref:histidine kinase n=2 Tax=Edaphosphingomonas TaxID=3423724 RepID=A0A2T4I6G8_9SPHN|nr:MULTISPECIES: ATP-binding protein [Sphingomonas]OHT20744.1 Blue-light-activated protein [Sphingomonas haloaromaticamans]PTD26221.1 hybrid sensor histidine kinase/response regulator [Sphingomonas fennica]